MGETGQGKYRPSRLDLQLIHPEGVALMAVKLADVKDVQKVTAPLRIVESGTGKAASLAVGERADGTLILARKSERNRKDGDGKDVLDSLGKPERETIYKPTAVLADIARALAAGLIA